jgi:hypothetical protein
MSNENPTSIEFIRTCFESEFYPHLFKGKDTHDPNIRFLGQIVAYTQDHDLMRKIVCSALPANYSSDAVEEVDAAVKGALEKGYQIRGMGGNNSKDSTQAAALISMVHSHSGIELFHDSFHRAYISIREEGKGKNNFALNSSEGKRWIQHLYYTKFNKPISASAFRDALDTLSAFAQHRAPKKQTHIRIAGCTEGVFYDLADETGSVVSISKDGYLVSAEHPVYFIRPVGMEALPAPAPDGDLREFQQLLGLGDEIFYRIVAFLIGTLSPAGPYMCLIVEGGQGSGKSLLCQLLKSLIDPNKASKLRMPRKEQDLMIQAMDNHLLAFDNSSGMKSEISDTLCTLSTGGGFSTRKLFTDAESYIFEACRPYVMNGIADIAKRPDLLERSISIKLPSMPAGSRKTESEILQRFREMLPRLLDKMFRITSCALRRLDVTTAPTSIRMTDAAKWIQAGEPETGFPAGSLLKALLSSQQEIMVERISNDPMAIALARATASGPFEDTVGRLYERIGEYRAVFGSHFPADPSKLSSELTRLKESLEKVGILFEFGPKKRQGKMIRIWTTDKCDLFDDTQTLQREGDKLPKY